MSHDDDLVSINALAKLLEHHENALWEVWDFIALVCVARCSTEIDASNHVAKLYEENFDRVRYVIVPPSIADVN